MSEELMRAEFERVHCGGNKMTARRNEHGFYVLPSVADAWGGWRSAWEILSRPAPAVAAEQDELTCDDCGAATPDPWHSSKGARRHYHRCDSCHIKSAAPAVAVPDVLRAFADEVKQLCKDFSDRQDRPYMGDVTAAIDGLYEQFTAAPASPAATVATVCPPCRGTGRITTVHGEDAGECPACRTPAPVDSDDPNGYVYLCKTHGVFLCECKDTPAPVATEAQLAHVTVLHRNAAKTLDVVLETRQSVERELTESRGQVWEFAERLTATRRALCDVRLKTREGSIVWKIADAALAADKEKNDE